MGGGVSGVGGASGVRGFVAGEGGASRVGRENGWVSVVLSRVRKHEPGAPRFVLKLNASSWHLAPARKPTSDMFGQVVSASAAVKSRDRFQRYEGRHGESAKEFHFSAIWVAET